MGWRMLSTGVPWHSSVRKSQLLSRALLVAIRLLDCCSSSVLVLMIPLHSVEYRTQRQLVSLVPRALSFRGHTWEPGEQGPPIEGGQPETLKFEALLRVERAGWGGMRGRRGTLERRRFCPVGYLLFDSCGDGQHTLVA